MKIYLVVLATVFMAELGDKTPLATLVYATTPGVSRLGVFLAAAAALILSNGLAVLRDHGSGNGWRLGNSQLLVGLAFIAIGVSMEVTR